MAKVTIDKEQLEGVMRLKPTLEDTASFFKCNARTIERFIKDEYGTTFVEFRHQRMVHTRHALIREAIKRGMGGSDVMLIFCLKNLCGWVNEIDTTGDNAPTDINVNITKYVPPTN